MSTRAQRRANRRNAQLSTGPKTEEGKRIASMNSLKTGLDAECLFVKGESREEFALLQSEWYTFHAPANPEERYQVDNLIRCEWLQRRFFRVEGELWEYQCTIVERATGYELGEAYSKFSLIFNRLQRRVDTTEKTRNAAKAELARLVAARPATPTPAPAPPPEPEKTSPQPQETKEKTEQLASFLKIPYENPETGETVLLTRDEYRELSNERRARYGAAPLLEFPKVGL
jgi:hypothetical protein